MKKKSFFLLALGQLIILSIVGLFTIYLVKNNVLDINFKYTIFEDNLKYYQSSKDLCFFIFISYVSLKLLLSWNYKLFIVMILIYIFVYSLYIDFYKKHFESFRFCINFKKGATLLKRSFILLLIYKLKTMALYIFKVFLLILPLRILIRISIFGLLNYNDDIIYHCVIIILPLPFIYYLLNFIVKYSTKKTIKLSDYYLFNPFVIKNINLYNVIFLIGITWIMKNYWYIYPIIFIILSLLIICVIGLTTTEYHNRRAYKNISLLANPGIDMNLLNSMLALGTILAVAAQAAWAEDSSAIEGYEFKQESFDFHELTETYSRNTTFNSNLVSEGLERGASVNDKPRWIKTTNWIHKNAKLSDRPRLWTPKDTDHMLRLANSSIFKLMFVQKDRIFADKTLKSFCPQGCLPQTVFINDKYIGSTARVNDILIVNFVKRVDVGVTNVNNTGLFFPTYYIPNNSSAEAGGSRMYEFQNIKSTLDFFERAYGAAICDEENITKIIAFTQAEKMEDGDLLKIHRPGIRYTDLASHYQNMSSYVEKSIPVGSDPEMWNYLDKTEDLQHIKDYGWYLGNRKDLPSSQSILDLERKSEENITRFFQITVDNLKKISSMQGEQMQIQPPLWLAFGYVGIGDSCSGRISHMCTVNGKEPIIFFKNEGSPWSIMKNKIHFIEMAEPRYNLLCEIVGDENNIKKEYYVILGNKVSVELLYIKNPSKKHLMVGGEQEIYTIVDKNYLYLNRTNHGIKHLYNISNQKDREIIHKLLVMVWKYPHSQ